MKVNKKILYSIVISCLLISAIFILHKSSSFKPKEQEKAKVETIFGCLETTDTIPEFEAKQNFMLNKLGYAYSRCG